MEEKDYSSKNAGPVLEKLEAYIERGVSRNMRDVCHDLSIFDWWVDRLSVAKMKQMRSFLKAAIKRGYTGYVCFKVGAKYCANGMWACKNPTTDGYSPDGDTLYRSFTPDYTYWSASKDSHWYPEDSKTTKYDQCKTVKELDTFLENLCTK